MKKNTWILIAALIPIAMIPLTGLTWVIFSIYCFLIYFKDRVRGYEKLNLNPMLKFFLFAWLFGMVTEIFAVVDNLPKPPSQRILLNPDPLTDLYLALGYYAAFALIWSLAYNYFDFSHFQIFLIAGAFGLVFEQTGGILFSFNPFIYLYIFLVYGSFQASAAVLTEKKNRKKIKWWSKIVVGIVIEGTSFLLAGLFIFLLSLLLQ